MAGLVCFPNWEILPLYPRATVSLLTENLRKKKLRGRKARIPHLVKDFGAGGSDLGMLS